MSNKTGNKENSVKKNTDNTSHIGSYIFSETLGEGTFATVKLGRHLKVNEKVAIKILDKTKLFTDPDSMNLVNREISILKKLRHKNIIQLYEIINTKDKIYLVMEYAENKELFDHIVSTKHLDELEACRIFQQLISCMEYLHSQKIAHRDLKPENLLLDFNNNLKLSDFGLSRIYNKTYIETPCGTPSYAPPEMLRGVDYKGDIADIWSCGILLFAMLFGYLPFQDPDEDLLLQKIINDDFIIPDTVSDDAKDLVIRILEKDPEKRITINEIKKHRWFNLYKDNKSCGGIVIDFHVIPVDDTILDKLTQFGINKTKAKEDIQNNKFNNITSIYYLLLKKSIKQGLETISDLQSEKFLLYLSNEHNVKKRLSRSLPQNIKKVIKVIEDVKDIKNTILTKETKIKKGTNETKDKDLKNTATVAKGSKYTNIGTKNQKPKPININLNNSVSYKDNKIIITDTSLLDQLSKSKKNENGNIVINTLNNYNVNFKTNSDISYTNTNYKNTDNNNNIIFDKGNELELSFQAPISRVSDNDYFLNMSNNNTSNNISSNTVNSINSGIQDKKSFLNEKEKKDIKYKNYLDRPETPESILKEDGSQIKNENDQTFTSIFYEKKLINKKSDYSLNNDENKEEKDERIFGSDEDFLISSNVDLHSNTNNNTNNKITNTNLNAFNNKHEVINNNKIYNTKTINNTNDDYINTTNNNILETNKDRSYFFNTCEALNKQNALNLSSNTNNITNTNANNITSNSNTKTKNRTNTNNTNTIKQPRKSILEKILNDYSTKNKSISISPDKNEVVNKSYLQTSDYKVNNISNTSNNIRNFKPLKVTDNQYEHKIPILNNKTSNFSNNFSTTYTYNSNKHSNNRNLNTYSSTISSSSQLANQISILDEKLNKIKNSYNIHAAKKVYSKSKEREEREKLSKSNKLTKLTKHKYKDFNTNMKSTLRTINDKIKDVNNISPNNKIIKQLLNDQKSIITQPRFSRILDIDTLTMRTTLTSKEKSINNNSSNTFNYNSNTYNNSSNALNKEHKILTTTIPTIESVSNNKECIESNQITNYSGPIDINCLFVNKDLFALVKQIEDTFKLYQIKFVEISLYKYHCTKNGFVMLFQLFTYNECKCRKSFYLKMKLVQGSPSNYAHFCTELLNKIQNSF